MGTPTLIVISGPAGAGKTTLAHRLAPLIGCPVVSRDEIKEGMVHANPGFVPSPGDPLTLRTLDVFFDALALLSRAGVTLVAEAAFQDHVWRPRLEPFAALTRLRVINCRAAREVEADRQVRRLRDDPTRAAHADVEQLREAPRAAFVPISLAVPTLQVDTTHGYRPNLSEIATFAGAREP